MCRTFLLSVLLVTTALISQAQYTVQGRVSGSKNEPLEGVSISVKNSYFGATSGKDGSFSFQVPDTGRQVVQLTMMGYRPLEKEVTVSGTITSIEVELKEAITDMKAVVITAGSFEASDKKRAAVLKSIDVVTTAGQQADVVAALKTLPGAQQVGEQEGLFVRGGTGAETKVFIDGMMVQNPFFSSVPGVAQRSRFSPLLFKGTMFSTGGYSALYGQALSSALVLESIDLPSRSEVNMIISSPQLSFMGQKLNKAKNGSAGININYSNLAPYFSVVKQKYDYSKAPEAINGEFNYRQKLKSGIVKLYAYVNSNEVGLDRPSLDHPLYNEQFNIRNKNIFTNATYSGRLKNDWQLYAGTSLSYNDDKIKIKTGDADTTVYSFSPHLTNRTLQSKVVFSKNFPGLSKLYVGTEYQDVTDGIEAKDSIAKRQINDDYVAAFVENDLYYSAKLVSRVGIRYEYSSLLNKAVISPRLSLAYKLDGKSQFSFAYGSFYQKPETNYLLRKNALDFSKATHYILNFQRVANGQTLRVEAFHKEYKKLLTTDSKNPFNILNEGNGYARGLELFWRDKTNVKNLDYWVSYSFLDTKRKYLDYPGAVQPSFAAKHTLSVVAKRFVSALSTQFSTTYSFASGRPYYNPNKPEQEFMTDKTINYHSLGLQANYLRTFGKMNAVFIANISNVLGSKQVFGYRYASLKNSSGDFASDAVTPMAKRFVFIGMYLSIGSDRRKEILD
jgi:outer membrane cobalamin receptor